MTETLFRDDAYRAACEATVLAVDGDGVRLDRTVFYPTGGGQPGDSGWLRLPDGSRAEVVEARKGAEPDEIRHLLALDGPRPLPGQPVTAEIDWPRRHRLMRMHTCLHLLSAAMPYPVTGGQVGDGKGRLDFDMAEGEVDAEALTRTLNNLIAGDFPVRARWVSDAELEAAPELVKTMSVRPPIGLGRVRLIEIDGQDLQACGGTHVARTGEIGEVAVRRIESKGKRNRRVTLEFV